MAKSRRIGIQLFLYALLCLAVVSFQLAQAQMLPARTPTVKTEGAPSAKEEVSDEGTLPKGTESLRQLQLDTTRRIEAAELAIKQTDMAISLIDELQSQGAKRKYDPDSNMSELEGLNKTRDFNQFQSVIQKLYFDFLGNTFVFNPRNSAELAPGTVGRRIYNRSQSRLQEINFKYQKIFQESLPQDFAKIFNGVSDEKNPIKRPFSDAELKKIRAAVSQSNKAAMDNEIQTELSAATAEISQELSKQKSELRRLTLLRDRVNEASDKVKKEINELAITLGLPLFCGTIIVLFIIPFLAKRLSRAQNDSNQMPGSFQFSTLVEISTVLLLTMSILILGLAGKLEPAVLGTLLGGISGYVLNRTGRDKVANAKPVHQDE